jgi:hypothetical protein
LIGIDLNVGIGSGLNSIYKQMAFFLQRHGDCISTGGAGRATSPACVSTGRAEFKSLFQLFSSYFFATFFFIQLLKFGLSSQAVFGTYFALLVVGSASDTHQVIGYST